MPNNRTSSFKDVGSGKQLSLKELNRALKEIEKVSSISGGDFYSEPSGMGFTERFPELVLAIVGERSANTPYEYEWFTATADGSTKIANYNSPENPSGVPGRNFFVDLSDPFGISPLEPSTVVWITYDEAAGYWILVGTTERRIVTVQVTSYSTDSKGYYYGRIVHKLYPETSTTTTTLTPPTTTLYPYTYGSSCAGSASVLETGDNTWASTSDAIGTDNGIFATSTISTGTTTKYLALTNYGFNIPDTPKRIKITVTRKGTFTPPQTINDSDVRLTYAGAPIGPNKASASNWSATSEDVVYEWTGLELQAAGISVNEINSSTFGIQIKAVLTGGGTATAHIDSACTVVNVCPGTTTTVDPNWENGLVVKIYEVNRDELGYGCKFNGYVHRIINGYPIVIVQSNDKADDCNSSRLPTTGNPCEGKCVHTWNSSTYVWDLTSDTCGSVCTDDECVCDEPPFCGDDTCGVYVTGCVKEGIQTLQKRCCTTTSTTNPPGCVSGGVECVWYCSPSSSTWIYIGGRCNSPCTCETATTINPCTPGDVLTTDCSGGPTTTTTTTTTTSTTTTLDPVACTGCRHVGTIFGWITVSVNCSNPDSCAPYCEAPSGDANQCIVEETDCAPVPGPTGPPPDCGGMCKWISTGVDPFTGVWWWYQTYEDCSIYSKCNNYCDCPTPTWEPDECGEYAETYCRCQNETPPDIDDDDGSPGTATLNPGDGTTTTLNPNTTTTQKPCYTTTIAPDCSGECRFKWSTSTGFWSFESSNCPIYCSCGSPQQPGTEDCQISFTSCSGTSTTTTSTTTTTTTTLPPCENSYCNTYTINCSSFGLGHILSKVDLCASTECPDYGDGSETSVDCSCYREYTEIIFDGNDCSGIDPYIGDGLCTSYTYGCDQTTTTTTSTTTTTTTTTAAPTTTTTTTTTTTAAPTTCWCCAGILTCSAGNPGGCTDHSFNSCPPGTCNGACV